MEETIVMRFWDELVSHVDATLYELEKTLDEAGLRDSKQLEEYSLNLLDGIVASEGYTGSNVKSLIGWEDVRDMGEILNRVSESIDMMVNNIS